MGTGILVVRVVGDEDSADDTLHPYARGARRAAGPVYVVSVSGPKFYQASDDDWVDNGAQLQVAAARTATYQAITVTPDRLDYRAVVASEHPRATTDLEPGDVLDSFTIHKNAAGKQVDDGPT